MQQPSISSRHPLEVEAVGLLKHSKQKVFMFSVLWSDHNQVLIYRSFAEFKKLQRELKRKFPLEAGVLNKSERTLPKLKDAPRTLAKKKATKRSLERLQCLETYSQTLLKLDAKISQCDIVVQFFTLNNHDFNPSFPEESLVIVPSEKKRKNLVPSITPDVSSPLLTNSYTCVADYETVDLKNRSFKVKRHELLDVLLKENTGWWLVENEARQVAWFPAPYLQEDRKGNVYDNAKEWLEEGMACVVIKAYQAQNSDELSVSIGVVVKVLRKSDNGWWLVSYNRKNGFVPCLYLKPYKNPCEKIQNILTKKPFGSIPNLYKDELYREVNSYLQDRPLQSDQRGREMRSLSLDSEARSEIESDMDSMAGSTGILNLVKYKNSSGSTFSSSLSESSSMPGQPRVPARPTPNEILGRCTTITKKKLEMSPTA